MKANAIDVPCVIYRLEFSSSNSKSYWGWRGPVHGLGACVRIRFFAARSSASINGFLGGNHTSSLAFVTIRGDACLYIPLFGWAMILAKVVSDSVTLISRPFAMVDQGGTEVPRRPAQILTGGVAEHG